MVDKLFVMHHAPVAKRKGEIIGSQTDRDLSEYGIEVARRQAGQVLQLLGSRALEGMGQFILSSPLRRAIQTSEIIAEKCNLGLSTDDRLKAQDFGVLDGMTFDEISRDDILKSNLWEYVSEPLRDDHRNHGGESNAQMLRRVAEFKTDTFASDNLPLIVTHGTVIDALIATIDKKRLDEVEGKNRVFEGKITKFTDSAYSPIGESLSAFNFIPGIAAADSMSLQKEHVRDYLANCERVDERIHLEKLLDIFERENGGIIAHE